jgi:hypothetical protein
MLTANDFRLIQIQTVLFTPRLTFRNALVLGHLLSEWGERFTKLPFTAELPANSPPELPHLILQSQDDGYRLHAGPSRLDVFRIESSPDTPIELREFLEWATQVVTKYLVATQGRAGRLACIVTRVAECPDAPGDQLIRHFCKDKLWAPNGPLKRSSEFEIKSAKRFNMDDRFVVNSAMKCSTGRYPPVPPGQQFVQPNVVVTEQELNTPAEELNTRQFSTESIRAFFSVLPTTFDDVMNIYFPIETE